jgi:mono/diheme cytochrome c family protein
MHRYFAASVLLLAAAFTAHTQSSRAANRAPGAFYSKAQAEHGKVLYTQNCSKCHLQNLKGNCPKENLSESAYVCSSRGTAPPLAGAMFMRRFYTIADLYSRVRWTMPGDNVAGLSDSDSRDIVAYLLQANGLPPGTDLKVDVTAMKSMVLNAKGNPQKSDAKAADALNDLGISEAYYTAEQAERGKAYFYGSCAVCHTADPNSPTGNVDASLGMGMLAGSTHGRGLFVGDRWLSSNSAISARPQRWDTVADLYSKISSTQPANDMGGLSTQEYLDIVAYIIHQNGFPAGKEELKSGLNQMRNMTLNKGYERLFNGKDLTGWGFVIGNNCAPRPEGCAQTVPGTTFKVDEGFLYTSGKPHGYAYPKKQFGPNFTLRLEYRYKAYKGMENDYDFYGNTGYLLFVTQHMVWPKTMEIQAKSGFEMSIVQLDGHATYTYDDQLREKVRKPAGEWNAVQIVSKGNEVWTYLNGALIAHVSAHDWPPSGFIGFEAESAEVHFRNLRIKPE